MAIMVRTFLIIESSGNDSFVALHLPTGEIEVEPLISQRQSQSLLPAVERALKGEEIDFIAIGVGPGSFTGTRVGVMTAKSLSFARNIPLVPFCSLKRYIPDAEGPFTITTDAKSQGFYTLKGERDGELLSFESPLLQREDHNTAPNLLNLTSLAPLLLKKFEAGETRCHSEIEVTYLFTP